MPTQHNSPIYKGFEPQVDASVVTILRSMGAVIFGKSYLDTLHQNLSLAQKTNPLCTFRQDSHGRVRCGGRWARDEKPA
jgi:Asp-tRNA(Asn)/Glu-tRNA(Gln) amidotransferase A subunit family amidase